MSVQEQEPRPGPDVPDTALTGAMEWVREFSARPGYAFSDGELLANLRAVHALIGVAEAAKLALASIFRRWGVSA